jgi:hypothetical protein
MPICETCQNDYDKCLQITIEGQSHHFDCFECAIQALAPECAHCHCKIIGHGVEESTIIYCCGHCASASGATRLVDRAD